MSGNIEYDPNKMAAMLRYIKATLPDIADNDDAVQTIAWYCDMESYVINGKSLTGATYYKTAFGARARELDVDGQSHSFQTED